MNSLSSNSHQAERPCGQVRRGSCDPEVLPTVSRRHSISFEDGNLAVLAGKSYFLVHQGLLCRHSKYLTQLVADMKQESAMTLEGRPVLQLAEPADDVSLLMHALYDGITCLLQQHSNLRIAFVILRLAATYELENLRVEALAFMRKGWPSSLSQWHRRERHVPRFDGELARAILLPHPIAIINLARRIGTPELLPSAFYDLSRHLPSIAAAGLLDPHDGLHHQLSPHDLACLLRGRESSSRFFSTFIVNELEGREPSPSCLNGEHEDPHGRRACQSAFDLVTFELLRDVNGVVLGRTSDPLFAMLEGVNLQGHVAEGGDKNAFRPCDVCRGEFAAVVVDARDRFWRQLPEWFGVDVLAWG